MVEKTFYSREKADLRERVLFTGCSLSEDTVEMFFRKIIGATPKGGKILDIGTGNGFVLEEVLNRSLGLSYRLFGLDNSEEMVKKAKEKLGMNAIIILGDNYSIPFESNSFDVVAAKNVTRFSSFEVYRVLRPKGCFVFREYGKGKGLIEIAELFSERVIRARDPLFYIKRLKKAGFKNIELKQLEIKRNYSKKQLLEILEIFPFIEGYSEADKQKVIKWMGKNQIEITSDPIMMTGRK